MKIKKLVSLCLGVVLCMAMLCMGIYAIQNFKLEVTGVIDFIAYEKLVYIEKVELKNFVTTDDNGETYTTQNQELTAYSGKYVSNSESVISIDISKISVMNGEALTIEITMKSLAEEEIVVNGSNNTIDGITITYSSTTLPPNPSGNVASGQSGVFIITISNANTGSVNLSDLKINISYAPVVIPTVTINMPQDSTSMLAEYCYRIDNGEWISFESPALEAKLLTLKCNKISFKHESVDDANEVIVDDNLVATRYITDTIVAGGLMFSLNGKDYFVSNKDYSVANSYCLLTFEITQDTTFENVYGVYGYEILPGEPPPF